MEKNDSVGRVLFPGEYQGSIKPLPATVTSPWRAVKSGFCTTAVPSQRAELEKPTSYSGHNKAQISENIFATSCWVKGPKLFWKCFFLCGPVSLVIR